MIIHCKDPYRPTSIMESNKFLFLFFVGQVVFPFACNPDSKDIGVGLME